MSIILLSVVILTIVMVMLINLTQKKFILYTEKSTQFECGFNSMTPSHLPFSFQFFLIAVLFLIFDIEIAMILSFPMEGKSAVNSTLMFLFLLILTIALIYEWQKGKIEWSK